MDPRVSVIMPVYNKAPWLRETIDSVLGQTYSDFEFLIFDDCSTDESAEIISSYKDPRIKFIRNKQNLGPGGSSNEAIKMARGEYIVRQDGDDISLKDRIASQVEFMDRHPGIGASSGHLQCFGGGNELWRVPISNDEIKSALLFQVPISQPASIIRKDVLLKHGVLYGAISNYIGEDRVLWFQLKDVTDFKNQDKVLVRYRIGEQNMGHDARFNRMQIRKNIYRFFFKQLGIGASEEEINIHTFCEKVYDEGLARENVQRFRVWLDKLLRINEERDLFPKAEFTKYVNDSWEQLFYRLVSRDTGLVPFYWKLSGSRPFSQVKFYAKHKINKLRGRK